MLKLFCGQNARSPRRATLRGLSLLTVLCLLLGTGTAWADTLTLPSALQRIEARAFMNDTTLSHVVVPENVTSIGAQAFAGSSVTMITLYDSVTYIAPDAFSGCNVKAYVNEGSYADTFCRLHGISTEPIDIFDTFRGLTCEMPDWFKSNVSRIFYRRVKNTDTQCVATLYDITTGLSFSIRRVGGDNHADIETMTMDDTDILCEMLDVSSPSQISSGVHYERRPVLLIVGQHLYACSMYAVPHSGGRPSDEILLDNGLNGYVMCLHFLNSTTSDSEKLDAAHQAAVKYAYNWWNERFGDSN